MRKSVVLPLPFGPSSPKSSGVADVEGDAIERSAVLVAVNEILNADHGVWSRPGGGAGRGLSRTGSLVATDHSTHRFYEETVLSIMRANSKGK